MKMAFAIRAKHKELQDAVLILPPLITVSPVLHKISVEKKHNLIYHEHVPAISLFSPLLSAFRKSKPWIFVFSPSQTWLNLYEIEAFNCKRNLSAYMLSSAMAALIILSMDLIITNINLFVLILLLPCHVAKLPSLGNAN